MNTILVADDEDSLRLLIRTTLENAEVTILEATDGIAALEVARRELPDLILLDWMMPGKTGLQVARELRADPRTAAIAILMLTAMGQEKDRKAGLAAGVQAFLVKPFSPLELLQRVQEVLKVAQFCRGERNESAGERDRKTA
ncbi:MAG TPA: response regulator [Terriglobales bacterium]|nr:response regulator [Terriglobales bacterium]